MFFSQKKKGGSFVTASNGKGRVWEKEGGAKRKDGPTWMGKKFSKRSRQESYEKGADCDGKGRCLSFHEPPRSSPKRKSGKGPRDSKKRVVGARDKEKEPYFSAE